MKRLFLIALTMLALASPAAAQNPTTKIIKRASYPAAKRGETFVNSSTGVPYICKSATCTTGGTGWTSMDAGSATAAPGGSSGDVQCNSSGSFGACATTGTGSVVRSTDAPTFTAVTYTNSWVDFGGTIQTVGYYKDPFGFVHLRGAMKSGTAGAAAFTLPTGFRPAAQEAFLVVNGGDATSSSGVTITSAGVVTPSASLGNVFVYLSSITFLGQ